MATWTPATKSSAATFTNTSKNVAVFSTRIRSGSPWIYDQADITYNDLEVDSENAIYYEQQGVAAVWTNSTKN